jgi:leader peptidase (prepilin peptidase)/N-methyltransferase
MPYEPGGVPLWLLKAAALAFGASLGSFANVLIHRLPRGESIVRPGSRCPGCGSPIAWYDNVPVLSWIVLRGRCRRCRTGISLRYPMVELCAAVMSLACLYLAIGKGEGMAGLGAVAALWLSAFAFCLLLIVITFVDLEHWRIPPVLTVTGAVLGVAGAVATGPLSGVGWLDSLIGLGAGGLGLAAVAEGYYLATRREGMGYGDVFLLGMIGAQLGWKALPAVLLLASLQGLLVAVPAAIAGRRGTPPWEAGTGEGAAPDRKVLQSPIPFGPFLALGALEWLFFGEVMAAWLFP